MTISHKVKYSLIFFTFVCVFNQHILALFIFNFSADYTLTKLDNCAHCVIQYSKEDDIFVKIDDVADVGANNCAPP